MVSLTLANGLRVLLAEDHTVPLVFLSWASEAGVERDPPGLEGLAALTPLLFRDGTARRGGDRITQELEDLGATLASGADWEGAFLNLGLLSCDLEAGVDLVLDMARTATFSEAAVDRLRRRRLVEIERRGQDPRTRAGDAFARALFGSTLYGREPLGTRASLQRIDRADVTAFHEHHYGAATSYFSMTGSFDSAAALDLLASFEFPAASGNRPALPSDASTGTPDTGTTVVDVPQATQTEIRIGHASVTRDCEDLPGLDLLGAILGGSPGSRLARRLRQQLGLSYFIRSRFIARRLGGMFVVDTSVSNDAAGAALSAIRGEIERLCDERIPGTELEHARRRLIGAELRSLQDLIHAGRSAGPAALRHDADYVERKRRVMATVEPEDLRDLARRYLHPEHLLAVVVGPAATLWPQLSSGSAQTDQCVPLESGS